MWGILLALMLLAAEMCKCRDVYEKPYSMEALNWATE